MRKELSIKQIYDDFVEKVLLSENEQDVLKRYIKNDSIVKIANETSQSSSSVSRTIKDIKIKYENYKKLELAKLTLLLGNK